MFAGACLGAEAVFLVGRSRLRGWARRRLARLPKLQAIERAVSNEGLKLVLLTRLSPAFPFSLLNLAYGLSDVSQRDYGIGLIAILPGTLLFCGLGELAGDVARFGEVLSGEADRFTWALRLIGLVATLAVMLLVTRAALGAMRWMDRLVEGKEVDGSNGRTDRGVRRRRHQGPVSGAEGADAATSVGTRRIGQLHET